MNCVNCGNPISTNARFCTNCGRPINAGLTGAERAELERLQLKNERSKRTWTILGASILAFLGGMIAFGPIGGLVALVIAVVVAAITDRKK